ncbi:MAG: diguanylate cyclase [Bacilli bacterium]|nr:diguanylate cyclase [Bacilli bacterium]
MELLEKSFDDLELLILDNPSSASCVRDVIECIAKKNTYMFGLPVLIWTDPEHMVGDDEYLRDPVAGLVSTADSEKTILTRIENAIKLCNSRSFDDFSSMLTALPSLIYLKDNQGRYAFCSQNWHHIMTKGSSYRGKTDFDIRKDKANAEIAYRADMKVVETGQGMNYLIKECDETGTDYLQIIKEPLKDADGHVKGIIAIVNNVTKEETMRQELREKSITDQLAGVYNRVYFDELTRTVTLPLPTTIISADCDDLKGINDRYGHSAGDQYINYAKEALQKALPEGSHLFRMGGDEFLAVIPSADKKLAKELVERIYQEALSFKNERFALGISVGSYTMTDPEVSVESAVSLSDKAMYRAKKAHKRAKRKKAAKN